MRRIFALACAGVLALATARADTTLVISIAADPTGLDPEAGTQQHVGLRHGDHLR